MRSGCLLHLRHYAQLPDYATAPLPPPAAELNAAAEVVKTLPPVSKYKVVAVAYCQYPKPTPPPVQQQQQQQLEPAGSTQLGQNAAAAAAGVGGGAMNNVQQGQGQQGVQPGAGVSQQQQQQSQGLSKGSSKKRRSKSYSTGWGYEDEFEDDRSEGESDESESNSEDDEYNDRNIRLTGIDSDADAFGSKQLASGSQSVQQAPSQQQQANGDPGPPGSQATTQQPQQQQPPVVQQRPPCMWVLLSPVNAKGANGGSVNGTQPKAAAPVQQSAPTPSPPPGVPEEDQLEDFFGDHLQAPQPVQQQKQRQKLPCLAVPLHIDSGLPDYLVQPSVYDASLQRRWLPQDRCSMFIGNRQVRLLSLTCCLVSYFAKSVEHGQRLRWRMHGQLGFHPRHASFTLDYTAVFVMVCTCAPSL